MFLFINTNSYEGDNTLELYFQTDTNTAALTLTKTRSVKYPFRG